jgi:hypothetical protein
MDTVELTCNRCGTSFLKPRKEHSRRLKAGATKFYCSRSCNTIVNNSKPGRHRDVTRLKADNRRDEFTPFRWFLARARARQADKGLTDLDVECLKALWDLQEGRCPLTGWAMSLPMGTSGFESRAPQNASLDRIDNSKGYLRGNVRYIAFMANLARADFTDAQVREFGRAVAVQPDPLPEM